MSALKAALAVTTINVRKYDPAKARPVYTDRTSVSVSKFTEELVNALGTNLLQHPGVVNSINNPANMIKLLEEYMDHEGIALDNESSQITVPPELTHLRLNIDRSSRDPGVKRFFCTTDDEIVDPDTSGTYYLEACGASMAEGNRMARAVVPKYMPRKARGVHEEYNRITHTPTPYFNNYIPAEWQMWKEKNPKSWNKLPAKPPEEIIRMLKHVIPLKVEREYFYAWAYTSMTSRSYVYLVLQGSPGVGKNRIKVLLSALHGKHNSVDGKKETFGAGDSKFNSQMIDNTMLWLDELKYGPAEEPRLKEYQNRNISIERKGVDATSSTEIFSSMVISNNYPRDNYILFNSRKFAPVVLGEKSLTYSMTPEEIEEMSNRLDPQLVTFDVKYAAQIAKWILTIGPKYTSKWPNLEYQGPKFWELAHSSMSRWQKISVMALTTETRLGKFSGWNAEKGAYLWSKVEEALRKKKEYDSKDYRDAATVRAFFQNYCDDEGSKIFEVEEIKKSVIQDFWVKTLAEPKKVSQVSLYQGPASAKEKHSPSGFVRPPGTSQFQWRKMKEEQEAMINGLGKEKTHDDEKEIDIL